eukprot:TRINITY_DN11274_c0_g2_i2.p1 TRINITY_DN11274_c0_g2~~TRINITY_DN11274_c0_g2_i2.p1  ORF type:complete len:631 (+),score=130.35 TRINITY_DN11274_c0_g2_i2:79-1971(+)
MATSTVPLLDEAVREYLLFRGFTQTLKVFEDELESDNTNGFQTDQLVKSLLHSVEKSDLRALIDTWDQLDTRFFSRLDHHFQTTTHTLSNGLKRLWLVKAIEEGRKDKVAAFFAELTPHLRGRAEWTDWFTLPYVDHPEVKQPFASYFQPTWRDMFVISLSNFMSTLHDHLPKPFLMRYEEQYTSFMRRGSSSRRLRRDPSTASVRSVDATSSTAPSTLSSPPEAAIRQSPDKTADRRTIERPPAIIVDSPERTDADKSTATISSAVDDEVKKHAPGQSTPSLSLLEDAMAGVSPKRQGSFRLRREPFLVLNSEVYSGHTAPVMAVAKAYQSPMVLSFDQSNVVRLWDSSSLATLSSLTPARRVVSACWARSKERLFYLGFENGSVSKLTTANVHEDQTLDIKQLTTMVAMACCPDNKLLACMGINPSAQCHAVAMIKLDGFECESYINVPKKQTATCVSFSSSSLIAVGTKQGDIHFFGVATGELVHSLSHHTVPVCAIRFTADLSTFLSLDTAGRLQHTLGTQLDEPSLICQLGPVTRMQASEGGQAAARGYDSSFALALDAKGEYAALAIQGDTFGASVVKLEPRTTAADAVVGSGHGATMSLSWDEDVILTGHSDGAVCVTNLVRV